VRFHHEFMQPTAVLPARRRNNAFDSTSPLSQDVQMPSVTAVPEGFIVRPLRLEDAEAMFALESAYKRALIGVPGNSLEEIRGQLSEPGFDPGKDAWAVFSESGDFVGYGGAMGRGEYERIGIDFVSSEPAVAAWLLEQAMERARQLGQGHGRDEINVGMMVLREDELRAGIAAEHGFTHETTYNRMRIDHTGPIPAPATPAGTVLRRGASDDATRRRAHQVIEASFRSQPGAEPRPYDDWVESRENRSTSDWSMVSVLEADGQAVAVRECSNQFVESDNCGYVGRLGVLEQARGRGYAKFLLQDAFALDAAAGRTGTLLHVDANNPTRPSPSTSP
jgi:mycothiol synthase